MTILTASRRSDPIFLLFFASGFSGLIYESVWSHYLKIFVGHAAYAQTLVLAVFIGGLALGSWLCARMAERIRNPLRAYALAEGAIGLIALVFHAIFVAAVGWGYDYLLPASCSAESVWCLSQWVLATLLLAPQAVLLGATFPLASSAVLRLEGSHPGHDVSALYFLNSLGAVLGVVASAFLLIPALGLPGTLWTAGAVNLVIALAALVLSRVPPAPYAVAPMVPLAAEPATASLKRLLLLTAFVTGLSSFIYEIVWIRMLSLVLGASTHSFELMLASFILGLALGGLWVRRRVDQLADPVRFLGTVQIVMGVAAAITLPLYNGSFDFMAWLLQSVQRNSGGFVLFNLASTTIALLVMLPATFCAGMTLPLITYRLLRSPTGERALGMVYSVNTAGALVGVALAVHVLLEALGLRWALMLAAAIDVALGVFLLMATRERAAGHTAIPRAASAGVVALVIIALAFHIDPRRTASGVFRTGIASLATKDVVLFHRDGKTASVDVLQTGRSRSIRTNGKPDASIAMDGAPIGDEYTMAMLAALPLGHRPDARTAAVIGFGSGMSTAMLLASPRLERVDTIEIEPAMVEGAKHFRPRVEAAYSDPRSRIVIDDAKSYFSRGQLRYDIIVSEPSNPWVSGVASLFTEEFYRRLALHLNDGGVLSQWLHTYEMDAATLASILQAMSKTFPEFAIYTSIDSDIVVVARKGGPPGELDGAMLEWPALRAQLENLRLSHADVMRRRTVAHWSTLHAFFGAYGIASNSDYYPIVDQRASRSRFTRDRVSDLTELQAAAVPMLEMLDHGLPPFRARDTSRAVISEAFTADAWLLRDLLLDGREFPGGGEGDPRVVAAQLVQLWLASCRDAGAFERALPQLVKLAEAVNPHLPAADAAAVWKRIRESGCARALSPAQAQWLDLFEAGARRDAAAMAAIGAALLERHPAEKSGLTELAFISTVTGLLCRGERERAASLLDAGTRAWLRPESRRTELRYLYSLATGPVHADWRPPRCRP